MKNSEIMQPPIVLFPDEPKLLGKMEACESRRLRLGERHVAPLVQFVLKLRSQFQDEKIPDFDPWDGGIEAEVLFLFEAPGPKACHSGFISRNNPDESAKNFFNLNKEAGIPRKCTISWNVVPWYIGKDGKIRPATVKDRKAGLGSLLELLSLLPNLRVAVLFGRKAQKIREDIEQKSPKLEIFDSPHPSPQFVNRKPSNGKKILDVLKNVAAFLQVDVPPV